MTKASAVKKQLGFLKLLITLPSCKRKKVITHCNRGQIDALCEIVMNFLNQNLTKNRDIIRSLKPFRKILHQLILKKTPLKNKKKILVSKRGSGRCTGSNDGR